MDSWIVAWSLKKQEGVPHWTHGSSQRSVPDGPRLEPQKRGGVTNRTYTCRLVFFLHLILSSHVEKVSVPRLQIFFYNLFFSFFQIDMYYRIFLAIFMYV